MIARLFRKLSSHFGEEESQLFAGLDLKALDPVESQRIVMDFASKLEHGAMVDAPWAFEGPVDDRTRQSPWYSRSNLLADLPSTVKAFKTTDVCAEDPVFAHRVLIMLYTDVLETLPDDHS